MKKLLKYTGACAAFLALFAFLFMMLPLPALTYSGVTGDYSLPGTVAIFGKTQFTIRETVDFAAFMKDGAVPASWNAIIAWILIIAAVCVLVLGVILPLLKIKALDRFAGVLNLAAVGSLITAGVFMFIEKSAFLAVVGVTGNATQYYHLGASWIVAGILAILAGVVAILPAAADFLSKGKKKRK